MTVGLDEKQKLQQVVFPEGLRFDGEKFGTAITCLAFKQLREDGRAESDLASVSRLESPSCPWVYFC
jgi:hypothetical protein